MTVKTFSLVVAVPDSCLVVVTLFLCDLWWRQCWSLLHWRIFLRWFRHCTLLLGVAALHSFRWWHQFFYGGSETQFLSVYCWCFLVVFVFLLFSFFTTACGASLFCVLCLLFVVVVGVVRVVVDDHVRCIKVSMRVTAKIRHAWVDHDNGKSNSNLF